MAKVEFNYKANIITILCLEEETMEEICKKFINKANLDINKIYFLYSGNKVDLKYIFPK